MFALINTGNKQYKVAEGDLIRVESLDDALVGSTIDISDVLMFVDDDDKVLVGNPHVEGVTVSARVNANKRGDKVEVIKFNRRKHHRKQMGHRQAYTELSIVGITKK